MSREIGKVNQDLEPLVILEFANGAKIECVVDTGFNGTLFLPKSFVEANGFSQLGREKFYSVGQGSPHYADVVLANIKWLGDEPEVRIIVSEHGSALIGASLLINAKLEIDYTKSTVIIEKFV